ncbi:hypothetical protein vseg_013042 [Gypsophila vaccaria]
MLLKNSIRKAEKFILKTLQNMKTMLFGSYDSIPRTLFLNPLSCTGIDHNNSRNVDHSRSKFLNRTSSDHSVKQSVRISPENTISVVDQRNVKSMSFENPRKVELKSEHSSRRYASDGTYILAQKMKELDMMEVGDVDHALDVEEALSYYSRLSCPVYVEIVDKFFMDMYEEFLLPQASITLSSSSRRLGPLKF